jgi:hypothetical protein
VRKDGENGGVDDETGVGRDWDKFDDVWVLELGCWGSEKDERRG